MAKKILITGSNGLLGQKLVELISKNPDYYAIATARGVNRLPASIQGYAYESLDVTNREETLAKIQVLKPDYIIHTAAMTNVDQCETDRDACWELNVRATETLVEACRVNDIFLVHVSTDFIFDGENGPYDEEAEANPISFYGVSKLAAERMVFKSANLIRWAVARTVLVYGIAHDMSRSNIVLWVKKNLEEGKSISVVNDQFRSPTLAEDLAMGCFLIVQKEAQGIYNISGKEVMTPLEMAYVTADYFKLDKSLIVETDSTKFTQPAKRPPRTGFIIEKAERALGYKPRSFEEGIGILVSQLAVK
jgi:dTDP-4-dehydrorhamnose reductase